MHIQRHLVNTAVLQLRGGSEQDRDGSQEVAEELRLGRSAHSECLGKAPAAKPLPGGWTVHQEDDGKTCECRFRRISNTFACND